IWPNRSTPSNYSSLSACGCTDDRHEQMMDHEKVNILLVDDQPAKLLAYEVILKELGENLVAAASGREALEYLLRNEVAVILMGACMSELGGFAPAGLRGFRRRR